MQAKKAARSPAKTSNSSATVAELTSAISAVSAAASAISKLTAATTKHTAAGDGETNNSDAIVVPPWGHNPDSPAIAGHEEHVPKKSKTWLTGHSTLSAFRTTQLSIDPKQYITDLSTIGETTLELDSHADKCVLGCDALILLDYDRPVIVEGYDPSLGAKTYATVSGALAYDDPVTGKVYHLVISQAIHIPHLDHHLLCPMQCWVNDVIVDNTPKFLLSDTTGHTHALTIRDPNEPTQMVILWLALWGVTLLLNVRGITLDEWNSDAFKWLHLTSETLTWDPSTTHYEEQEAAMVDYSGHVVMTAQPLMGRINHLVINLLSSLTTDQADITDDENFYDVLASHVWISLALSLALMGIFACARPHLLTPRP
jgi:hypothetical protein